MSQIIVFKVKSSIYGHKRGWCFTPNDFLHLGHDTAVRQILSRLQKAGFIRRLSWGLYDYPRKHPKLGLLPPDIQEVVKAIERKDRIKTLASGAHSANLLGLSEQVPAKIVYLTEGLSKRIRIGKQDIIFKKTTPKNMATADTFAGLVIQALKHLGENHIDETIRAKLKKRFSKQSETEILLLKRYCQYAPAWIKKIIFSLIGDTSHG